MVRMRSPVQTRFAAPFFCHKKYLGIFHRGTSLGILFSMSLLFEVFLVIFGFAKAKNQPENIW